MSCFSLSKYISIFLCLAFSVLVVVNSDAQDFKVVIDAGHGGKDPGATGHFTKEKHINLGVALLLGEMIKENHPNVKVIFTRDDDFFVELQERANIANRSKAQLFISIHTNASKNNDARGTETYTMGLRRANENLEVAKRENSVILLEDDYKVKYEGFDPTSSESYIMFELLHDRFLEQSISIASSIQREFRQADCVDRGVRQDVFLVLRNTGMPSVLVEVGYISNPSEEVFLGSKSGQKKIASAIYSAFCQFKRNFDNRQGRQVNNTKKSVVVAESAVSQQKDTIAKVAKSADNQKDELIFKVQILASPVKLSTTSPLLKRTDPVDFFIEKGLYKYTFGSTANEEEINKIRKQLSSKFKDCFVVVFKGGEKIMIKK
jgi:N-acetylmuramoyl-L-alanine amidase